MSLDNVLDREMAIIRQSLERRPRFGKIEIAIKDNRINGIAIREEKDKEELRTIYSN